MIQIATWSPHFMKHPVKVSEELWVAHYEVLELLDDWSVVRVADH